MTNRLSASSSPYLLQHADNPVDWWEWGPDAFDEARRRDVPVLLSVGYAACHWCHVMAHESFEDDATARLMNDGFVNIKVDREERPDVDAVYMEAVQGLTGQGGWPMTVFLTTDAEPFYAGTYFPPVPRHGMPSFTQLIDAIGTAWRERRDEVLTSGRGIARSLGERAIATSDAGPPGGEALDDAVRALNHDLDPVHFGFGGAPKFPPSMTLEHLLRHHARTGNERSLDMVTRTCEAMARGGLYDQLGGGFARYSVDSAWVVPHFEKMLYDNALLLRVYVHLWRATGSVLARRVALETADFLVRDLRTPEGGFASALDADSEGVEGRYYVWTPTQLADVLGVADGAWAAELLNVTQVGTFEHGQSVLQLLHDPTDDARWQRVKAALHGVRGERVPPARDDKVVAAWNGLAIAALAEAGALLDRPDLVHAAAVAADLLTAVHLSDDSRLRRVSRHGAAGAHAGVLEDYADVVEGLLTLYAVTGDPARLRVAGRLLDVVLDRFSDADGGFYDTADDAERLLRRPQDPTDNATPSGWSAACGALLSYAAYTGSTRHRDAAESGLAVYAALAGRAPRFAGWGLAVAEAWADGPKEVAVVGELDDPATVELHRTALRGVAPGMVVAVGPGDDARLGDTVPLLGGRPRVDGAATAYVCRDFVCERPVTTVAALAQLVGVRH